MSYSDDNLPLEFDHSIYVNHSENSDISSFNKKLSVEHYDCFGLDEGRTCSKIQSRKDFDKLVQDQQPILEIGPFFSPSFRRPESNVYYLDCISTKELTQRAKHINDASVENIPEIDYVWTGQGYAELIKKKFNTIYSAHNIEHQPCLITHLNNLENILTVKGAVFLVIPDKRYCFDHFFPETTLSDIIDAWKKGSRRHRLKDILDHHFFHTHNDPVRHWQGDHGLDRSVKPVESSLQQQFFHEIEIYYTTNDYWDVHAWKFTPYIFKNLFNELYSLKFTNLCIARVYPTIKNSNEFYAILVRGRKS